MDLNLLGFGECRYEGQMQSQRLRMVSDSELRLEQFQAERKDEKRRYEDALDRLKQVEFSFNINMLHLYLSKSIGVGYTCVPKASECHVHVCHH